MSRELVNTFFYSCSKYINDNKSYQYINGNYFVMSRRDGSKVKRALRFDEDLCADFPDSIDLKITNACSIGCKYCHESSVAGAKKFNLEKTIEVLDKLPKCGIEVAVGGGDIFDEDCISDAEKLVGWLRANNFQPRITVNYKTLQREFDGDPISSYSIVANCYEAVGVSIEKIPVVDELFKSVCRLERSVFHIIAGIFPVDDIMKLYEIVNESAYLDRPVRILILGYKQFGRAAGTSVDLETWKKGIKRLIFEIRTGKTSEPNPNIVIGFDNLALEQLDIESSLLPDEWNNLFCGCDFSSSMYVDAVEETFGPTSRSPKEERVSWDSTSIVEYFKKNHL